MKRARLILASALCAASLATTLAQRPPSTAPDEMLGPLHARTSTAAAAAGSASTRHARELVVVQRGDWPIILSAPHGGQLRIPGAATRTGNSFAATQGAKNSFTTAYDGNVDAVAFQLADEIYARTGHRPYVVAAGFTRRQVDANRPPEEAYESEAGQAQYEKYHAALRAFRGEIVARWHRGLLIDLHGHGVDRESIIRGTADWTSVRHLVDEFGKEAITQDLLGPLGAKGNAFIPPLNEPETPEFAALNGGYIVRTYGSYAGGNFDAIQLELASKYRGAASITGFCEQLADGIVPFTRRYLLTDDAAAQPASQPATIPSEDALP